MRNTIILTAVIAAAAAGVCDWYLRHSDSSAAQTTIAVPAAAVPVIAATVGRRDVPIYLRGIGTVVA